MHRTGTLRDSVYCRRAAAIRCTETAQRNRVCRTSGTLRQRRSTTYIYAHRNKCVSTVRPGLARLRDDTHAPACAVRRRSRVCRGRVCTRRTARDGRSDECAVPVLVAAKHARVSRAGPLGRRRPHRPRRCTPARDRVKIDRRVDTRALAHGRAPPALVNGRPRGSTRRRRGGDRHARRVDEQMACRFDRMTSGGRAGGRAAKR